jgi:hypothetical protein
MRKTSSNELKVKIIILTLNDIEVKKNKNKCCRHFIPDQKGLRFGFYKTKSNQ